MTRRQVISTANRIPQWEKLALSRNAAIRRKANRSLKRLEKKIAALIVRYARALFEGQKCRR